MSRPGGQSDWSGPHLPIGSVTDITEDLADPAKGERVPRCLACGLPNPITFALVLRGKWAGMVRLCDHCYYEANPIDPRVGDPLAAA